MAPETVERRLPIVTTHKGSVEEVGVPTGFTLRVSVKVTASAKVLENLVEELAAAEELLGHGYR